MSENNLKKILNNEEAKLIARWCNGYSVIIEYKAPRKRKLGDYRKLKTHHVISVNNDLSPALLFLTLTHEIAHMHAFSIYGHGIKPHGKEWKKCFGDLIRESVRVYPNDLQKELLRFAQNPKANFYAYAPLVNYFHLETNENVLYLKDIEKGKEFNLEGKIFIKGEKRKIKYLCKDKFSGKSYIIHGMAPVERIE